MSLVERVAPVIGVPDWLRGCWQRRRIDYADGRSDRDSRVFWIQGAGLYGDLRLAPGRPAVAAEGPWSPAEAAALARQQGATGFCRCDQTGYASWHREWGYQPVVDFPEPGLLRREGAVLIERAPSGAYEEEWLALTPPGAPLFALRRLTAPRRRLIVVGDCAMLIAEREGGSLPPQPLERTLAARAREPAALRRLLDCEISFARREGSERPFVVRASTLPWREGEALALPPETAPAGALVAHAGASWIVEEYLP